MATTTRPPNRIKAPEDVSSPNIIGLARRRSENPIKIMVNKKTTTNNSHENGLPLSRVNLIKLTEKLAEDAKNGNLEGLGGFAVYKDGYYEFGLEGSYLLDPESAVLPLMRLHRRIMNQIEEEDHY